MHAETDDDKSGAKGDHRDNAVCVAAHAQIANVQSATIPQPQFIVAA